MLIQKIFSAEPKSKWKFIFIADDIYLVNETNASNYIKIDKRIKGFREIVCEGAVENLELFTVNDSYIFKYYDDIYEIIEADDVSFLNFEKYYSNKDEVMLFVTQKNQLYMIVFWKDQKGETDNFEELYTIDFSLIPSAKNLETFFNRIIFINDYFYYKNENGDMLLIRFNFERIDTYEVPSYSTFVIDNNLNKYLYARYDIYLIDIINFKLYDISDAKRIFGDALDCLGITLFQLKEPALEFIFWSQDCNNLLDYELISQGNFREVKGLLYCYSLKKFIFYSSSNPQIQTFCLYDYAIPNIIKTENGFTLFYMDKDLNLQYCELNPDIRVLTKLDCYTNGDFWNKVIFTNVSDSNFENKSTIIIRNSIFLSQIEDCSSLGQIIHMNTEDDSKRFIISKFFGEKIASLRNLSNFKGTQIVYLYSDDCCTIETPWSKYGRYTLLILRDEFNINYYLSFNSFKKFILCRKANNNVWYDHLLLKCLYSEDGESEKTAYVDVTAVETVSIETLINDAFNYE